MNGDPEAIASQRSGPNVEPSNDARSTAAHSLALRTDGLDSEARVLDRLGQVALQGRPRFVGPPAFVAQQLSDQCVLRRLDVGLASGQDPARRIDDVGGHSPPQLLVAPRVRRGRQPQQPGTVQQSDGEDLPVPAPHPDRGGRRRRAEPPVPAQVTRVQLHRRPVVLPPPKRVLGRRQPVDVRLAQYDRHPPITHHRDGIPHPVFSRPRDPSQG
ncbi:hypothetical protein GCM10029992_26610 [Glycomyces albus]